MLAYVTPDAAAGDYACRRLSIPVELLHIVTGALADLADPAVWEQVGTMTPDEAASLMLEVVNTYQQSAGECDMYMGMVVHMTLIPPGINDTWLLCDNGVYLKSDYPDYWQMLVDNGHDSYWEVDSTHFSVPDLRERFIAGTDADIGLTGGEASHVLTSGEMPAHTHTEIVTGLEALAVAPGELPVVTTGAAGVTGSTGGGGAHNNMPPYVMLYPFIRVKP